MLQCARENGSDPIAREAVRVFVRMLGAVAGNLALIFLPFGGVYLIDRLEELTGVPMPDDFVPPGTDIRGIAARVNEIVGESS